MKISVVGCGSMGKNHARVLKTLGVLDYIVEPVSYTHLRAHET
jgi:ketol-acid reductoisomerase